MIPCITCHHLCSRKDQFCSQCGTRDPTGLWSGPESRSEPLPSTVSASTFDAPTLTMDLPPDSQAPAPPVEPPAPLLPIAPGVMFAGRYRLESVLGEGAMAIVCSATDLTIDEIVALKILSSSLAAEKIAIERFKRELKLARKIRHRNVVQSFDIGFDGGRCYISMEYIDAKNLARHLARRGRFQEPEAVRVLQQVLRGLKAAHDLGIIHRDIKPGNILLNQDGMAFVTDFGVATSVTMTDSGEVAGTPEFMAPEQFRAEPVGPETDLYSCGVLFYMMLAGKLPFRSGGFNTLARAHEYEEPHLLDHSLGVSETCQTIISWMLQKDRARRPQRATDVLEMIDQALALDSLEVRTARPVALAVVDDEATLSAVTEILGGEGYHVIGAHSTRAGIDLVFENDPAVIILDAQIGGGLDANLPQGHVMPTIEAQMPEALAFCRIVRYDARLGRVPILVLATEATRDLAMSIKLLGANEVLPRDQVQDHISAAVKRLRAARSE